MENTRVIKACNVVSTRSVNLHILVNGTRDFYEGGKYLPLNPQAMNIRRHIASKLESARDTGYALLLSLEDDHRTEEDYRGSMEGKILPFPHGITGTSGAELEPIYAPFFDFSRIISSTGALYIADNDIPRLLTEGIRIKKNTLGSKVFANLVGGLDYLLTYRITSIHFYGVLTGVCILANASIAKAFMPNTPIYVHKRGCADLTEDLHEDALVSIARLHVSVVD